MVIALKSVNNNTKDLNFGQLFVTRTYIFDHVNSVIDRFEI